MDPTLTGNWPATYSPGDTCEPCDVCGCCTHDNPDEEGCGHACHD